MRRTPTEAERVLWLLLRDRRLTGFKFRRQVPVHPFIVDFICYEARLIVELDGSQHAGSDRDAERDRYLQRAGFRILRIWNDVALSDRETVLDAIWLALTSPSSGAARHLLPRGEKGASTRGALSGPPPGSASSLAGEVARSDRIRELLWDEEGS